MARGWIAPGGKRCIRATIRLRPSKCVRRPSLPIELERRAVPVLKTQVAAFLCRSDGPYVEIDVVFRRALFQIHTVNDSALSHLHHPVEEELRRRGVFYCASAQTDWPEPIRAYAAAPASDRPAPPRRSRYRRIPS